MTAKQRLTTVTLILEALARHLKVYTQVSTSLLPGIAVS